MKAISCLRFAFARILANPCICWYSAAAYPNRNIGFVWMLSSRASRWPFFLLLSLLLVYWAMCWRHSWDPRANALLLRAASILHTIATHLLFIVFVRFKCKTRICDAKRWALKIWNNKVSRNQKQYSFITSNVTTTCEIVGATQARPNTAAATQSRLKIFKYLQP